MDQLGLNHYLQISNVSKFNAFKVNTNDTNLFNDIDIV